MIWYMFHNALKILFPNMETQHRNLTTFLIGVVLYTLFYSYVGTLGCEHTFLNVFFKYSIYIVIADAFAMAILYKNFYKHTIFREVEETIGANPPKQTAENVEPIIHACAEVITEQRNSETPKIDENNGIPQIEDVDEEDEDEDSMEGFVKDSALGDSFTTSL